MPMSQPVPSCETELAAALTRRIGQPCVYHRCIDRARHPPLTRCSGAVVAPWPRVSAVTDLTWEGVTTAGAARDRRHVTIAPPPALA